jgi:hypothetical protein
MARWKRGDSADLAGAAAGGGCAGPDGGRRDSGARAEERALVVLIGLGGGWCFGRGGWRPACGRGAKARCRQPSIVCELASHLAPIAASVAENEGEPSPVTLGGATRPDRAGAQVGVGAWLPKTLSRAAMPTACWCGGRATAGSLLLGALATPLSAVRVALVRDCRRSPCMEDDMSLDATDGTLKCAQRRRQLAAVKTARPPIRSSP